MSRYWFSFQSINYKPFKLWLDRLVDDKAGNRAVVVESSVVKPSEAGPSKANQLAIKQSATRLSPSLTVSDHLGIGKSTPVMPNLIPRVKNSSDQCSAHRTTDIYTSVIKRSALFSSPLLSSSRFICATRTLKSSLFATTGQQLNIHNICRDRVNNVMDQDSSYRQLSKKRSSAIQLLDSTTTHCGDFLSRNIIPKSRIPETHSSHDIETSVHSDMSSGRFYPRHFSLPLSTSGGQEYSNGTACAEYQSNGNQANVLFRSLFGHFTKTAISLANVILSVAIILMLMMLTAPLVQANEPGNALAAVQELNKFGIPAIQYQATDSGGEYSVTIQILAIMTVLAILPSLLILMTSFTRIIVVLAILRQAIGLQQTPSNQILLGLSLFLTLFVMMPIFRVINVEAVQPYLNETITSQQALDRALVPVHEFMLGQTRETDLQLFVRISGEKNIASPDETPLHILIPAFVTSELKTAFQIGFLIFIPFLIIDLVVASILMAMGMMMLSPIIISLPFKIMLFVLIDGWAMIMGTLANSFGTI